MARVLYIIKDWILDLLGFKKHDSYVKKHLNDANIRSSIYMSFVIIILEIWMIARSTNKYVIPAYKSGTNFFDAFFSYTSLFFLFMLTGAAMMIYSIYYFVEKSLINKNKKEFGHTVIAALVIASLLVSYTLFIFKEINNFKSWDSTYYIVSNLGVIFCYIFAFLMGVTILGNTIYKLKTGINSAAVSVAVIIFFAAMCLTFGIKVGYTDFFSRFNQGNGLPKPVTNTDGDKVYEIKSIICFFTMIIYVGCLLIWRPYISIIMLTSIFTGYYFLLDGDPVNRIFSDGEKVNYITFLVSLSMVTVSIYQQRLREARKSENLEHIAKYDTLTEIHSYDYYVTEISKILPQLDDLAEYSYLFINIQNFKTYNDQMGFSNGTFFLQRFAKKVEELFNEFPSAREADDHFVAFAKNDTIEEKIKLLNEFLIEDADGLYLNLKVGAVRPIYRAEDINTSIDRARYAADTIINKYGKALAIYDDVLHDSYKKKQYIINHIDDAVEKGYIKAYYQPVVWSKDKKLCGCEALARWIDPKYGFLSPAEFIPTLEEVRLIHKLDRAIFEIVCKDLRRLIDEGKPCVPVSINFSRLDFELMDAVLEFEKLIKKYDVPKEYVHVEITESALTENQAELQKAIDKLHKDGFAIWLDDFGSGYSSLNVLKDFKFDVLKIDMKFLTNFEQKPETKIILDAIVKLSEKIGMLTLTEGVETEEQAEFLSLIGCGRLQGYLFGKPIPLDELEETIKNGKYKVSEKII